MKITPYTIVSEHISQKIRLACVSDLHARDPHKTINALQMMKPDIILLAGDIFEVANEFMKTRNENAYLFLKSITDIAPIFYCFGNHEIYYSHASLLSQRIPDPKMHETFLKNIGELGIHLVNNSVEAFTINNDVIYIGGVVCGYDTDPNAEYKQLDVSSIHRLDSCSGFKILLCHYPHYYPTYVKNTGIDLTLSGHAHGGQWRIFNRGIYSPHQGLFPKYTSGIHDGRFIISRGAVNNSRPIPRFFNPTEILEISLIPSEEAR